MIKNLNDLLSVIVLIVLMFFSLRILISTFVKNDDFELAGINRMELIKNYIDNEEE